MTDGKAVSIAKLQDKQLQDKLKGNINFFDPEGASLEEGTGETTPGVPPAAAAAAAAARSESRPGGAPGGIDYGAMQAKYRRAMAAQAGAAATGSGAKATLPGDPGSGDKAPEKILVRFFDADVQPGKTYQYSIQVRMANPNFGKKTEVAFAGLADKKELVSPLTITPTITISEEFFVYAVDTSPKELQSKFGKGSKGTETDAATTDRVAVQIHRWADKIRYRSDDWLVADWVIAERLLLHRGEPLGRAQVDIEVPVWNKRKGSAGMFELAMSGGSTKGKVGKKFNYATPVDFVPPEPSILVDFEGGKHAYVTRTGSINDDAAAELLIVNPPNAAGKMTLSVRSAREDTDPTTDIGKERTDRYKAWHERIHNVMQAMVPASVGPGAGMPGGARSPGRGGDN
jgi:hypothetical protein